MKKSLKKHIYSSMVAVALLGSGVSTVAAPLMMNAVNVSAASAIFKMGSDGFYHAYADQTAVKNNQPVKERYVKAKVVVKDESGKQLDKWTMTAWSIDGGYMDLDHFADRVEVSDYGNYTIKSITDNAGDKFTVDNVGQFYATPSKGNLTVTVTLAKKGAASTDNGSNNDSGSFDNIPTWDDSSSSSSTDNNTTSTSSSLTSTTSKPSTSTSATSTDTNKGGASVSTTSKGNSSSTVSSSTSTGSSAKVTNLLPFNGAVITKNSTKVYKISGANMVSANKTLKKGTTWKTFNRATVNGQNYYNVGGNQYIKNADVKNRVIGVAHVNYNKHYGIQIWAAKLGVVKNANGTAKKLKGQTNWKVFATATLKGHKYYNLGGDQYIDARYITIK
ncbi:MAG: SLAP domain-containing protein [Lacticaseibacillus songhuajiangensis]|jgi:hypothetical protein|nr:SLAP domain-containing protein [Lacticaseibacillus songhuajiangensis]